MATLPNLVFEKILNRTKIGQTGARRELLQNVIMNSPDGIVVLDEEGDLEMANPAFFQMTGLAPDSTISDLRRYFGKNFIIPMSLAEVQDKMLQFERHLQNLLGEKIKVIISHYFVHDKARGGKYVVFQFRDARRGPWVETETERVHDELDKLTMQRTGELEKEISTLKAELERQKITQRALLGAKAELKDFFVEAPVGMHWIDAKGVILRTNKAELKLLGYTHKEYIGRNIREFHVDEDAVSDVLQRLHRGEEVHNYEARLRRKDGGIVNVAIDANGLWRKGEFVSGRLVTTDMTERKWLEEKLLDARKELETDAEIRKEQFRSMIENASDVAAKRTRAEAARVELASIVQSSDDAILSGNAAGIITSWNPAAARLFGYAADEIMGRPMLILSPLDRLQETQKLFERIQNGHHIIQYETVRLGKDKGEIHVSLTISPIRDGTKIAGFSAIIRDITERRKAEAALRESEERYYQIIDAVTDYAIIGMDRKGYIQTWNRGAERIYGFRGEKTLGKHFSIFCPEEGREAGLPEHFLEEAARYGKTDYTGWRVKKDGTRFWADVTFTALKNENNEVIGFSMITRDRTNWYNLEKAKEDFISTATHELRTPLTALQGYLSLLQKNSAALTEKQAGYIDKIWRSSKKLHGLVENLLNVLKIEEGDPPALTRFSLAAALDDVVGEYPAAPTSKKITVKLDHDREVFADPDHTKKILSNLIGNAIKYTKDDGRIEVYSREIPDRHMLEIFIKDNGVGIPAESLPNIFYKFYRVPNDLSVKAGGTGLGLYIVKRLAEAQGGGVFVQSEPGHGSVFSFTLPLAQKEQEKV